MWLLLLFFLVDVQALLPPMVFGRPREGFLPPPAMEPDTWTDPSYMIYSNIIQVNDHFGTVSGTWKQRYQYNSKFFNPSRPLAFLWIGGESQISEGWVRNENVTMMTWAQEFGAAAFQPEHRFYGPKEDQTTEHLQLMTIEQALADLDTFIDNMNRIYFSNYSNIKWITFGGSYPGTLSAFFREAYPNRTIGAVSTSSAVHFLVDQYSYMSNMEYTYRTNGSDRCANNIGKGFKKMIDLSYGGVDGRSILQQKFNLCETFDDGKTPITKTLQFFFSNIIGVFQSVAQYTGDNSAYGLALSVPLACQIMNNESIQDEVDRLNAVWNWYDAYYGVNTTTCKDNNYTNFIRQMSDPSMPDSSIVVNRGWLYQCCSSFGYLQTTDGNSGIFGSTIPLDFYADQCKKIFGDNYALDNVYKAVDKYRTKYYDNYSGTKVVFPNGELDPYRSLGMTKSNPLADVDSFLINGTAHCADRYPTSPNDPQSLVDARKRIHDHVANWINEAFS